MVRTVELMYIGASVRMGPTGPAAIFQLLFNLLQKNLPPVYMLQSLNIVVVDLDLVTSPFGIHPPVGLIQTCHLLHQVKYNQIPHIKVTLQILIILAKVWAFH